MKCPFCQQTHRSSHYCTRAHRWISTGDTISGVHFHEDDDIKLDFVGAVGAVVLFDSTTPTLPENR